MSGWSHNAKKKRGGGDMDGLVPGVYNHARSANMFWSVGLGMSKGKFSMDFTTIGGIALGVAILACVATTVYYIYTLIRGRNTTDADAAAIEKLVSENFNSLTNQNDAGFMTPPSKNNFVGENPAEKPEIVTALTPGYF